MESTQHIKLTVNNKEYIINDNKILELNLLTYLREHLKLKDVKCGCNKGFCGSCIVIINNEPKKSCILKIKNLNNAIIKTPAFINFPSLSKYTQILHDANVVQCGFCFPAITCSLYAKLKDKENITEDEVKTILSNHICRCTGYIPIINAICNKMPKLSNNNEFNYIGKPIKRDDSYNKLTGSAKYADDIEFNDMLYVYVLRSKYAYAKILSIDISKAKNIDGVELILLANDLPAHKKFGILNNDQPILCDNIVSYYGDAIALIVAKNLNIAKHAASLIEVSYEPLKPIFDAKEAIQNNNIMYKIHLKSKENVEKYIDQNEFFSISETFSTQLVEHAYLEPESSIAYYDEKNDKIIIYSPSQNIHADREEIAKILGVNINKIEVRLPYVGGGFGGKEDLTTQIYSALATFFTKKPCKYTFSRDESILCSTKKHPIEAKITISANKNGNFGAIILDAISDCGPYASLSQIVLTRFATHILGPYTWQAYDILVTGAKTNNLITGAMRGFGVNQACYIIESIIDKLAYKLNIDPITLRNKNIISDGKIMGLGEIATNSSGLKQAFDSVVAKVNLNEINEFNKNNQNIKRGVGFALAYKNMGLGNNSPRDKCSIKVVGNPNLNQILIYTSASDIGQGIYCILKQIAAESLNISPDYIKITGFNTTDAPPAGVTSASRQTFMSGNALINAIIEFKNKICNLLEQKLNLPKNSISINNENKFILNNKINYSLNLYLPQNILEAIKIVNEKIDITYTYNAPKTCELDKAGEKNFKSHFGYSYGACAIIVEVNLDNKTFKILNVITAYDVGRIINPSTLYGQITGGTVMGLGYAISERLVVKDGIPDKRGFAGFGLLRANEIPNIEVIFIESNHPEGPYGARGIGEISTVPIAPALCNALKMATHLDFNTLPINFNENNYKYLP